jgi:hypothetical protein
LLKPKPLIPEDSCKQYHITETEIHDKVGWRRTKSKREKIKSTGKISIQPESRNFFFLLVLLLQVKKKHGQDTSMPSFVP